MNLKNNGVVIVTGAEGHLGSAICDKLSNDGFEIIGVGRTQADLSDSDAIDDFSRSLGATPVSGIVLNAGQNFPISLNSDESIERIRQHMEVNFFGHVRLVLGLLPRLCEQSSSRIVAVSSTYAERARVGRAPYSVSKSALEAFIRSVAIEYSDQGVLANSIRPGFLDTPLTTRNNSPEAIQAILSRVPAGVLGTVETAADLVAFLMSNRNSYITGQSLAIDGGFSIT